MSYMLIGVVVTWMHSCVKICLSIHLTSVYFTVLNHATKFISADSQAIIQGNKMRI